MFEVNRDYTDEELLELAENGESDAYVTLGLSEEVSGSGAKARKRAIEYYTKAADMGNVEGINHIVGMLRYSDEAKEIECCNKYAKIGYEKGCKKAAIVYLSNMARGNGIEADPKTAKKMLKRLAKDGDPEILTELGELYLDEKMGKVKVKKGIKILTEAAEQHFDIAEFNLGCIYLYGRLVEKDLDKAEDYLNRAKQHGFGSIADENIAEVIKQKGDVSGQIKVLEQGMKNGNEEACISLIEIYKSGKGVKRDKKKAFEVALSGAKMGYPYAMCMLGDMYEEGKGTVVNLQEALKWYRAAAKNGMEEAAAEIVRLYRNCGDELGITAKEMVTMSKIANQQTNT